MQLTHVDFTFPATTFPTGALLQQLANAFPMMRLGITLDGLTRPTKEQLGALCVAAAKVQATRPEKEEVNMKITLSGLALNELLTTGHSEDLTFVLDSTPNRELFDSVQLDLPATKAPIKLPLIFQTFPKFINLPCLFKLGTENDNLFALAADYPQMMAVPVQPITVTPEGTIYPHAYPNTINAYQIDLYRTFPQELQIHADFLRRTLAPPADMTCFDFIWTGSLDNVDIYSTLRPVYNIAQALFAPALG